MRLKTGLVFLLASAAISLVGCSTNPPMTSDESVIISPLSLTNQPLFGSLPSVIDEAALFRLTPDQKTAFLSYLNHSDHQDVPVHRRVFNYIARFSENFDYLGETHVAADALHYRQGNCLSLAIVTTALARLAGVQTGYQLIESTPVFEKNGNTILRGRHVRTVLSHHQLNQSKNMLSFAADKLIVDYFPDKSNRFVKPISEREYIAMYYRNLAVHAMVANDLALAFAHTSESLRHAPQNVDAINLLALLHRRAGDMQTAEVLYQHGIAFAEDKQTLLSNYRALLQDQKRLAEAQQLSQQLVQYDKQHPYRTLKLADDLYQHGDISAAITHYQRVIELAPYLHEAHFGLAKSHYRLGDLITAQRKLKLALEQANEQSTRQLYFAKLATLSSELAGAR